MAFDPITKPVDFVIIAGQRTPGIATIEGAGSPRQWDERKGYDLNHATLRFRGKKLAHFSIKIRLATPEDFAAWATFSRVVLAVPVGGRGALDVSHPILADLDIGSAVVEDVLQPTPGETGEHTVEIKMIERKPPSPAGSTSAGSVNTPTPNPLQAEIDSNSARIRMLNAEAARYR
jgi:hypothetical protein